MWHNRQENEKFIFTYKTKQKKNCFHIEFMHQEYVLLLLKVNAFRDQTSSFTGSVYMYIYLLRMQMMYNDNNVNYIYAHT